MGSFRLRNTSMNDLKKTHDGVLLTGRLDTGDNLGTLFPFLHHLRDDRDRILEIAVHLNRTVAGGLEHAIIGTVELTEVLGVEDGFDPGITGTEFPEQGTGIILGIIVDKHKFVIVVGEALAEFLYNRIGDGDYVFLLVVTRDQDTNLFQLKDQYLLMIKFNGMVTTRTRSWAMYSEIWSWST